MLAFENAEEFTNLWWLDAYCFGRYPQAALAYLRETGEAPDILPGDLELLREGTPDYIGVNYYYTLTFTDNPLGGQTLQRINTTGQKGTTPRAAFPASTRRRPTRTLRPATGTGPSTRPGCASPCAGSPHATVCR